jgi:hypothetical protein
LYREEEEEEERRKKKEEKDRRRRRRCTERIQKEDIWIFLYLWPKLELARI